MTPHELLRLTPRTNCGSCGHPACLAFAVAVTKGGADPSACPYLDLSGLDPACFLHGEAAIQRVEDGQRERDMVLATHLKSKIKDLDFSRLAAPLGVSWTVAKPDALCFAYLNRPVVLSKDLLLLAGKEPADPRDTILLYNYVAFGGGRLPSDSWVGMESLPNSISKVTTLRTYCENRLASRFSGRGEALIRVCSLIGAGSPPEGQSATVSRVIPVLPHVPQLLLFWDAEPEDGFDARVKILFDSHVLDFLDLESLVFSAERLADRLAELDEA